MTSGRSLWLTASVLAMGCEQLSGDRRDETCPTCTTEVVTVGGGDTATPVDTGDWYATPEGEYAYDPDCIIGYDPIPTVYYVYTWTIDGDDVTGTDEMVWVSHPSTGTPVCSFSWPVTGTTTPCDDDCDLRLDVRSGESTNHGCADDRASWGPLFANSRSEWFLWYGEGDEVRVSFSPLDDGHAGTLVDGVLTFVHTQCNGA